MNIVIQLLEKGDIIIFSDIKTSPLNKYIDLKKAIHNDYALVKKEFNHE